MLDLPLFDADFVARLRDGDPKTEQHFAVHFGHLLDIKLRSRLRTSSLRDDARQETLLRVFNTLRDSSKRQPENLGAFVNAVCNNVLLETFRQQARSAGVDDNVSEPADRRADPEAEAVRADNRRVVRHVLTEMGERDRILLREVFLDELDKDDVCRRHKIDREYLRVVLHRARARFRLALEGYQGRAAAG